MGKTIKRKKDWRLQRTEQPNNRQTGYSIPIYKPNDKQQLVRIQVSDEHPNSHSRPQPNCFDSPRVKNNFTCVNSNINFRLEKKLLAAIGSQL